MFSVHITHTLSFSYLALVHTELARTGTLSDTERRPPSNLNPVTLTHLSTCNMNCTSSTENRASTCIFLVPHSYDTPKIMSGLPSLFVSSLGENGDTHTHVGLMGVYQVPTDLLFMVRVRPFSGERLNKSPSWTSTLEYAAGHRVYRQAV